MSREFGKTEDQDQIVVEYICSNAHTRSCFRPWVPSKFDIGTSAGQEAASVSKYLAVTLQVHLLEFPSTRGFVSLPRPCGASSSGSKPGRMNWKGAAVPNLHRRLMSKT